MERRIWTDQGGGHRSVQEGRGEASLSVLDHPEGKNSVVILAGGRGARFNAESEDLPKPLIPVAGKPILGHVMDIFESQGFEDFIILGGYKCQQVADYVANRYECRHKPRDYIEVFGNRGERVKVHVFDTGLDATTGGRLYRLALDFMPLGDCHFLTYADGLADVDLNKLLAFHKRHERQNGGAGNVHATVTAVRPPGRFGVIDFEDTDDVVGPDGGGRVDHFGEKPEAGWINGGFMVVDRGFSVQFVPNLEKSRARKHDEELDEMESFESGALVRAAKKGRLDARIHMGYWRCMDTRRDLEAIEADVAANGGRLPWMR